MPTTITLGPDQVGSPRYSPHTQVESTVPPRGHRRQSGLAGISPSTPCSCRSGSCLSPQHGNLVALDARLVFGAFPVGAHLDAAHERSVRPDALPAVVLLDLPLVLPVHLGHALGGGALV